MGMANDSRIANSFENVCTQNFLYPTDVCCHDALKFPGRIFLYLFLGVAELDVCQADAVRLKDCQKSIESMGDS